MIAQDYSFAIAKVEASCRATGISEQRRISSGNRMELEDAQSILFWGSNMRTPECAASYVPVVQNNRLQEVTLEQFNIAVFFGSSLPPCYLPSCSNWLCLKLILCVRTLENVTMLQAMPSGKLRP